MHDRTRRPSIWTVHAPHSPRSHAFFGPVNANSSRNASRSVARGSTFSVRIEPLTVILTSMRKSLCDCAVYVFIMFSWLPSEILRRTVDSLSHCTGSDHSKTRTPIYKQRLTGDESGIIAGKKGYRSRDLLRSGKSRHRHFG